MTRRRSQYTEKTKHMTIKTIRVPNITDSKHTILSKVVLHTIPIQFMDNVRQCIDSEIQMVTIQRQYKGRIEKEQDYICGMTGSRRKDSGESKKGQRHL